MDIVGDSSKFQKATDDAVSKTGGLKSVLSGAAMGVGLGAFNLATDAVMGFVGALGDAGEAARADAAEQSTLARNLKSYAGATNAVVAGTEDWISAQARLGYSDSELRDSFNKTISATGNVEDSQKIAAAAMDLARAKGISLEEATDVLTKAYLGQTRGLKTLGIEVDKGVTGMDAINAATAGAAGAAEEYANTSEGRMAAAQIKQDEAWEKIGTVVMKITDVVLPLAADAFAWIADTIVAAADAVQPFIDQFINWLMPIFAEMQPVLQELGVVFQTVFAAIGETVKGAVGFIMGIWDKFGGNIIEGVKIAFNYVKNTIQNVLKVVQGVFDIFSGIFSGDWNKVWGGIKSVFTGIWDQIKNVFSTVINLLRNALDGFGKLVGGVWDGIVKGIGDGVKTLVGFFTSLPGKIANAVGGLFDGIPKAFKAALNWLIRMWNNLQFKLGPFDLGPMGTIGPWTLGTPNLPYFHQGGVVPGTPGSDVLAVLQAGETVVPAGRSGGSGFTIIVQGDVYGDGIDALADKLALRMRLRGA